MAKVHRSKGGTLFHVDVFPSSFKLFTFGEKFMSTLNYFLYHLFNNQGCTTSPMAGHKNFKLVQGPKLKYFDRYIQRMFCERNKINRRKFVPLGPDYIFCGPDDDMPTWFKPSVKQIICFDFVRCESFYSKFV